MSFVDHRDGDGLNNRRGNIRRSTSQQNMQNQRKQKGHSEFKGVSRAGLGWIGQCYLNKKRILSLTTYSEEEAALAYDCMAEILHGEFCKLNFPLVNWKDKWGRLSSKQRVAIRENMKKWGFMSDTVEARMND